MSDVIQFPVKPIDSRVLHLITQRNQPYGSTRHCCEECGAYGTIVSGKEIYTTDPDKWENSSNNCWKRTEESDE